MSENPPRIEEVPDDDAQPLTGEPVGPAPMRLRAEPPRVTRLSRKVLAGLGLVASVGLGGALIHALQTRDAGRPNDELYSTENRSTADGLAGLPRDYSGVPQLGPPLPGDLGRPILSTGIADSRCPHPGRPRPIPASARKSSAAFRKSRPRAPAVSSPDRKAGAHPLLRELPQRSRRCRIWRALASLRRPPRPRRRTGRTRF